MAIKTEISVNLKELESCEKQLGDLAASITNKKLNISLTTARGGTADQLQAAATELKQLAAALEKLVSQTRKAVNSTRVGFEAMDEQLAGWFGATEE